MKQEHYTDGIPNREVTAEEDMNKLYQGIRDRANQVEHYKKGILHTRDRIDNLKNLIRITREALSESQLCLIKQHVTDVLYFFVEPELEKIEEELSNI